MPFCSRAAAPLDWTRQAASCATWKNGAPATTRAWRACLQASSAALAQGSVGAGTGATVSKMAGPDFMTKGGLGSASLQLADGTIIGAIAVVNALGDIVDPQTQQVIAEARNPGGSSFLSANPFGNTTIAVV